MRIELLDRRPYSSEHSVSRRVRTGYQLVITCEFEKQTGTCLLPATEFSNGFEILGAVRVNI